MTRLEAVRLIALKSHPKVTPEMLRKQKLKICAAAKKWRLAQPPGMMEKIAENAGVTQPAVCHFEQGRSFSADVLRGYYRYGFDPVKVRLIKALSDLGEVL